MKEYKVFLGRKHIDSVFYLTNETRESVKKSLVEHDGYDPEIRIVITRRKMENEYEIHGNYGDGYEYVCTSSDRKEVRDDLKSYRENDPKNKYKIVVKRIERA